MYVLYLSSLTHLQCCYVFVEYIWPIVFVPVFSVFVVSQFTPRVEMCWCDGQRHGNPWPCRMIEYEAVSDREVLLKYYNELLSQNKNSSCKRRKVSTEESDSTGNHSLILTEIRNTESCESSIYQLNESLICVVTAVKLLFLCPPQQSYAPGVNPGLSICPSGCSSRCRSWILVHHHSLCILISTYSVLLRDLELTDWILTKFYWQVHSPWHHACMRTRLITPFSKSRKMIIMMIEILWMSISNGPGTCVTNYTHDRSPVYSYIY